MKKKLISLITVCCMLITFLLPSCTKKQDEEWKKHKDKTIDPAHVIADGDKIADYFIRASDCDISVVSDAKEGSVIKITTSFPTTDPFVYFDYNSYIKSCDLQPVNADDHDYVLLKLKAEQCSNTSFELFFCAGGIKDAAPGSSCIVMFDNSTDDWQYVCFDLSSYPTWTGLVNGFRMDWMFSAADAGESISIAEIHFLKSKDEVNKITGASSDVSGGLSKEEQKMLDDLLATIDITPPDNTKLVAADEDASLELWFDHSYTKTPGESTKSNGMNTYKMYLAANESEGCQFILASAEDRSGLKASVTQLTDSKGNTIPAEIYMGYYFDDVDGKAIADPLPPLTETFDLTGGRSQLFLIKITAPANTPAGDYSGILTITDSEGKEIKKANVHARVWDFILPDAASCKTQMDISWWNIYTSHECYEGDDGLLYKKYYDFLLDNKVCGYTLPYATKGTFTDERVLEYLNDPRVVAFNPIDWKTDPNQSNVTAAYEFLSQKQEWLDKAYFYVVDEPMDQGDLDRVNTVGALLKEFFPGYHLIVPMHLNSALNPENTVDFFDYVKEYVNSWCPHTFFYNTFDEYAANPKITYRFTPLIEKNLGTFADRMAAHQKEGDEVWWYVTRFPETPEITLTIDTPAINTRILFWQQKLYDVDNFLYYLVNDWYINNDYGWNSKHEIQEGAYGFDVYGNGVLVYSGAKFGINGPVGSLRLEYVRDGIEDFEYFTILSQLYGEETADLIIRAITTSLSEYTPDTELFTTLRIATGALIEKK